MLLGILSLFMQSFVILFFAENLFQIKIVFEFFKNAKLKIATAPTKG